jgi:hypothetical protein
MAARAHAARAPALGLNVAEKNVPAAQSKNKPEQSEVQRSGVNGASFYFVAIF